LSLKIVSRLVDGGRKQIVERLLVKSILGGSLEGTRGSFAVFQ